MTRIEFGATLPSLKGVAEFARRAEALGYDYLGCGEHMMFHGPIGNSLIGLSIAAGATTSIKLMSSVVLLPLYTPMVLAKLTSVLDVASGGRYHMGIGIGGEFAKEFEAVGIPLGDRGARTDEAMAVLRALWRGGPVSHHGPHFSFDDVELRPVAPPRGRRGQPGGPPLLVSGRKPAAMRRAARLGDGWMPYLVSADAYARSVATIGAEAERIGRGLDGFEWAMYLYCSIRRDGDRAREDVAAFLGGAYGDKPREQLDRIAPAGTPDEVAARIQAYVDAGVRHVIVSPAAPDDTLEVVELAVEEVLPQLRMPAVTP